MYSPWEPAFGCRLVAAKPGDLREPALEPRVQLGIAFAACSTGANGCSAPNSGQVTGIISAVALSFIVHDPSGIIDVVSDRSLACRRCM